MRWRRASAAFSLLAATQPVRSATATDTFCVEACRSSFDIIQFAGSDPSAPAIAPECNSSLNLQSLYLCVGIHCSRRASVEGLDGLNETCSEATGVPIPPFDIVSNYTRDDIEALPRFNATNPPRENPVRTAILPVDDLVDIWIRTFDVQAYVRWHHWIYGWAIGLFWAGVVAIGMVNHAASHLEARNKRWFSNQSLSWGWTKQTILTPATFGRRCAQDYGGWCTVPPFVQTLTIVIFILLNFVCCIHGYKIFPGHMYFPSKTKQVLRHLSDRTGIISFANFPIIWLFGMRNNVVLWLTGWDFGTYNNFHRWVARVATLQAVIHSIGYTVMIFQEGGWEYFAWWWTLLFWWAGELATILMCALLAFSVYWLRRQQYEMFLLVHIGLSILLLISMLGHVSIFDGEYNALVWVPALIWLADRILRVARVLAFDRGLSTTARATFNAATNMVRLEIPVSSSMYTIRPGTFFYLTMPNDTKFWESHPFTVASASKSGQPALEMAGEADPLLEGHQGPEPPQEDGVSSDAEFMTFLIRPYDSFTSRLRDLADAQWPKPAPVRIIVDGPYGNTLPLNVFDHVVFVVGGSGIVVPLTYAKTLTTSSTRPRSVHVHWAAREAALVTELLEQDLREALNCENFHLHVYLTASDGQALGDGGHRQFKCAHERINVAAVLETVVDVSDGSIAVVACGPAQMADEARRAAVQGMKSSTGRIDYFEESFQW